MVGWIIAGWVASTGLLALLALHARRQLFVSRAAFAALAQRAPVGILKADADGKCTFANDTWCELSGLSQAETIGLGWTKAVFREDLPAVTAKWEESVRSRQPYVNELRLVQPDGSLRHVLASGRPTFDKQGRLEGFIGTVLDVSGQRLAQQQAREKESLLRALINNSSAAIYLKDVAGRYLLINQRHMELFPAMRDFKPGTTPFDWFPEDVARSFIATDSEVVQGGQTKTFEEAVATKEGTRFYLTVKFPVFNELRQVVAVGGISADITEMQLARQRLAERERLLQTLIDVQENEKQLLCHEFHDGLIQYAVGSKMLLEGIRDRGPPGDCRAVIGSVIECLAKGIEEGRRVIRGIRPAVLDDLGLRAAIDDLVSDLQETGTVVESRFDTDIDMIPTSLQTTVYRVVQEALNNARKHSGSQRVGLSLGQTARHVSIKIEDFGCGFDLQATEGSGFGLVSMRERSRLLGGECSVESTPGKGTTITILLPVSDRAAGDVTGPSVISSSTAVGLGPTV